MVVILNNGQNSGAGYQQPLLTTPTTCHLFGTTNPLVFSNTAPTTTLCCLHCCRPLTVHVRVGLLGCSPYRNHQHSTNSPCGSLLACIPCGRWFDTSNRQNTWFPTSSSIFLNNWNNQLLLRFLLFLNLYTMIYLIDAIKCKICLYESHNVVPVIFWEM